MKIGPHLSPCTKLKSKWIKDFNIKPNTMNLIEEKVGKSLELIGTGVNFLNRTPVAHSLRSIIDKWDLMKLKSFSKTEDPVNKTKWQPIDCVTIFTNSTSDRVLISKIYKELKKLDINNTSNPIKKWDTELNRELSTEES